MSAVPGLAMAVIGVASAIPCHARPAEQAWQDKRELWFTEPAAKWKLGLPVGNGRLGAGKYKEAHDLYESAIIMGGAPEIGSYQTLGDLWIEHVGSAAPAPAGYRRALDLATGVAP